MDSQISFVITSCGRFDLLEETLASFFRHNRAPIARYVLVEDSGDEAVRDVVRKYEPGFEVLVNQPQLGQLRSIDRAYAGIATPFIFHCEDDWRFLRGGFLEDSLQILTKTRRISGVLSRTRGQNNSYDATFRSSRVSRIGALRYRIINTKRWPPWGGYSFNPSLIRVADYQAVGPFARFKHEAYISDAFVRRGMALAGLEEPACETIGRERHVDDPFLPPDWLEIFRRPENAHKP